MDSELLAAAIALSLAPPEEKEQQPPPPPPPPPPSLEEFLKARTPESMLCPIKLHLLDDPVVLFADGCTYSRAAIEAHLALCRQSKWISGWIHLCVCIDRPSG